MQGATSPAAARSGHHSLHEGALVTMCKFYDDELVSFRYREVPAGRWRRDTSWRRAASCKEADLLKASVYSRTLVVVESLLDRQCNPNVHRQEDGNTPLHLACRNGHVEIVSALLAAGADVGVSNWDGWTPLHFAAYNGFSGLVEALLQGGRTAVVSARDQAGRTALHLASERGHRSIIEALLRAGADPESRDAEGRTALDAARREGYRKAAEVLQRLAAGANAAGQGEIFLIHGGGGGGAGVDRETTVLSTAVVGRVWRYLRRGW